MSNAVITVVAGRHEHLRAQRRFLADSEFPLAVHVIVAVDDPDIEALVAELPDLPTVVLPVPTTPAGLPIAAARNAGAAAAIAAGAQQLTFLDVDCLPAPDLLERYDSALAARPDAIVCGPVTYLPPDPAGGWTAASLAAARRPHAARPDPAEGVLADLAPQLFWSLSFAVTAATWQRIGGFYEGYVGYGGEDTDFAATAHARNIPVLFVGHADAFHQYHAVSDPPVEHVDDILRNSNVYLARHGNLPMRGWLEAFARDGLVRDLDAGPRRTSAIRVATVPAQHPYLDAVLPATVERVDVDRVQNWAPDPLLEPARLQQAAHRIDVVHVHFGYDHLSVDDMAGWLESLDAAGIPLVLTVHDLRNPHHESPERHDAHLRAMAAAANRVVTLTDAAAQEFERRFGRSAEVVPHPSLLVGTSIPAPPRDDPPAHVLVPLKSLRRNVKDPIDIVRAVAAGAARSGARARVLIEPSALERPDLRALLTMDVDLDIAPYLPHDQVCERVAHARACVLPYRFGTHSGWVELCHDLGTHLIAPDCGHYAAQWAGVRTYGNNELDGLDSTSLVDAVAEACSHASPRPADPTMRAAARDLARAHHDALYRAVTGR